MMSAGKDYDVLLSFTGSLLIYIIAALVWWFISLEKQNEEMRDFKISQLNATVDSIYYPRSLSYAELHKDQ